MAAETKAKTVGVASILLLLSLRAEREQSINRRRVRVLHYVAINLMLLANDS